MASAIDNLAFGLSRLWYSHRPAVRLLWPFGAVVGALVAIRRGLYAVGILRSFSVAARVVVVGNISIGGTGKTPVVLWLCRALSSRGISVGVAGSGYRGSGADEVRFVTADADPSVVGDEAVLIARKSRCPVAVCRDRVAAARALVDRDGVDVVVCDDGLQHLRLRRDFEIAVVDGGRGVGNGLCLPFGPLREPVSRLRRTDAVIINGMIAETRSDGTAERSRGDSTAYGAESVLHCSMVLGDAVELASGRRRSVPEFAGTPVHAVAAIGHPERFFASLRAFGIDVDGREYRDHAVLGDAALTFADGRPVLVTEKDAVKIESPVRPGVWAVTAEIAFADTTAAAALVDAIMSRTEGGAVRV